MKVEYDSNNSGGRWWLTDDDWRALEAAGWDVQWCADEESPFFRGDRFLGALAQKASIEVDTVAQAIASFEEITGQDTAELGCYSCCGPPHSFRWTDADGKRGYWSPEAPATGSRYGND